MIVANNCLIMMSFMWSLSYLKLVKGLVCHFILTVTHKQEEAGMTVGTFLLRVKP